MLLAPAALVVVMLYAILQHYWRVNRMQYKMLFHDEIGPLVLTSLILCSLVSLALFIQIQHPNFLWSVLGISLELIVFVAVMMIGAIVAIRKRNR